MVLVMATYAEPERAKLVWGELTDMLTTAMPFRVSVSAVGDDKQPLSDYRGQLTVSAVVSKVCLVEGFEGRRLGLWCVALWYRTHAPVWPRLRASSLSRSARADCVCTTHVLQGSQPPARALRSFV